MNRLRGSVSYAAKIRCARCSSCLVSTSIAVYAATSTIEKVRFNTPIESSHTVEIEKFVAKDSIDDGAKQPLDVCSLFPRCLQPVPRLRSRAYDRA
jgi:hypothetical protein